MLFLIMRAFKIYSLNNSETRNIVLLTTTMLYMYILMIYFITGSLYLSIAFAHFAYLPPPSLAIAHLFSLYLWTWFFVVAYSKPPINILNSYMHWKIKNSKLLQTVPFQLNQYLEVYIKPWSSVGCTLQKARLAKLLVMRARSCTRTYAATLW